MEGKAPESVEVRLDVPECAVVLDAESARNAELLHGMAAAAEITTSESFTEADELLANVGGAIKGLETQRLMATMPLRRATEAINAVAKRIRAPLEQARDALRGKILAFQEAKRLEADRERARLALLEELKKAEEPEPEPEKPFALDKGPVAVADLLPQVTHAPPGGPARSEYFVPQSKAVTRRKTQALKITDRKKIPRAVGGVDLWILDEKAVLRLLKAGAEVPGCEIEKGDIPVGRRS